MHYGPTDGQSFIWRCENASKNVLMMSRLGSSVNLDHLDKFFRKIKKQVRQADHYLSEVGKEKVQMMLIQMVKEIDWSEAVSCNSIDSPMIFTNFQPKWTGKHQTLWTDGLMDRPMEGHSLGSEIFQAIKALLLGWFWLIFDQNWPRNVKRYGQTDGHSRL